MFKVLGTTLVALAFAAPAAADPGQISFWDGGDLRSWEASGAFADSAFENEWTSAKRSLTFTSARGTITARVRGVSCASSYDEQNQWTFTSCTGRFRVVGGSADYADMHGRGAYHFDQSGDFDSGDLTGDYWFAAQ